MPTLDMIDAIEAPETTGSLIPVSVLTAKALAGYIAGNSWRTWLPYCAARPDLLASGRLVSITLTAYAKARCFDIEKGGGSPAQAPFWYLNYADHTFGLPILYTFASAVQDVINAMSAAQIARERYYIWSADPSPGRHICGDASGKCRWPPADLTQFGQYPHYDISMCNDYVFQATAPLPPLPGGATPVSITAFVNKQGHDTYVAMAQPAKPGECGEVFDLSKNDAGNWNGIPDKTSFDWQSKSTPGK
jgi:hypothetical protein